MAIPGIRNRGFTLVELIIVIAVVAILATVAVSSVLHHQDNARNTALVENARVIALAVNAHNATTAPPITEDALHEAQTAEALVSLLGSNTPVLKDDSDVAAAVKKVAVSGGFASVIE